MEGLKLIPLTYLFHSPSPSVTRKTRKSLWVTNKIRFFFSRKLEHVNQEHMNMHSTAFFGGIWAKEPLGSKYQFYQNTYCPSEDAGSGPPLRCIIFHLQIRDKVLDIKLLNSSKEAVHSHFDDTTHTIWILRVLYKCVFLPAFHGEYNRIIRRRNGLETSQAFLLLTVAGK